MPTLSLILVYSFGKSGNWEIGSVTSYHERGILNYKEHDRKANRYPEGYVNMQLRLYDNITNQGKLLWMFFSSTCQVRVSRFYQRYFLLPSFLPSSSFFFLLLPFSSFFLFFPSSFFSFGIATASSGAQWALPDLNCELQRSVPMSRENVRIDARIECQKIYATYTSR